MLQCTSTLDAHFRNIMNENANFQKSLTCGTLQSADKQQEPQTSSEQMHLFQVWHNKELLKWSK